MTSGVNLDWLGWLVTMDQSTESLSLTDEDKMKMFMRDVRVPVPEENNRMVSKKVSPPLSWFSV